MKFFFICLCLFFVIVCVADDNKILVSYESLLDEEEVMRIRFQTTSTSPYGLDIDKLAELVFLSNDPAIDLTVQNFCKLHYFDRNSCDSLLKLSFVVLEHIKKTVLPDYDSVLTFSDLERNPPDVDAEETNKIHFGNITEVDANFPDEQRNENLDEIIFENFLSQRKSNRIAFIHNCLLSDGTSINILEYLMFISDSGLLDDLDALWVLHYGAPLEDRTTLQGRFPKVSWIDKGIDVSSFEKHSIRHVHTFAKNWEQHRASHDLQDEDVQVLYLHTEVAKDYSEIRDLRSTMLYFLVERHRPCHHLLLSGEFDVLGCHFHSSPRHLQGNMWWASSRYLNTLPTIQPYSKGHTAENWLFLSPSVRLYVLHQPHSDPSLNTFGRANYATSTSGHSSSLESSPRPIEPHSEAYCLNLRSP